MEDAGAGFDPFPDIEMGRPQVAPSLEDDTKAEVCRFAEVLSQADS
jgi:hypothetical protein